MKRPIYQNLENKLYEDLNWYIFYFSLKLIFPPFHLTKFPVQQVND